MDGVGFGKDEAGDAVKQANTPTLDWLLANCPNTRIKAHGTAVGLPSDADMGNSEVGHNALGCGQIYSQGAKLVNDSIESGSMFRSGTWLEMVENCVSHKSAMHFIGLLSDGNVHSNISHLKAMIAEAKKAGVSRVCVHILLDGRDVPATSALQYVDDLEDFLAQQRGDGFDCRIASGGGRMVITMDRYQANWNMVKAGWDTHVHGEGRQFATAKEAIETYRREFEVIDQDLPAFVIAENGKPVGTIEDNDSVIFYNFRGDRAIEISMAFEYDDFDFNVVTQPDGDVKSNLLMRALESFESIKIIRQAIANIPDGKVVNRDWEMFDTDIIESYIEVPRGTLYHSYALESGRIRHSIIRTPSMANIGAMQYACIGDHVTDAQLCIVQCDPCFTCTDRAIEIIRR